MPHFKLLWGTEESFHVSIQDHKDLGVVLEYSKDFKKVLSWSCLNPPPFFMDHTFYYLGLLTNGLKKKLENNEVREKISSYLNSASLTKAQPKIFFKRL